MADCTHCILIVDDELAIQSLIKRYFEKRGALVLCAGSGDEMHQYLSQQPVDLVLLDVGLPGKDGFTLLEEIKRKYAIGVIMLTAQNALQDRISGLNAGADDYVPKPFDMSELLARSNAVLRRLSVAKPINHGEPDMNQYCFAGYCLNAQLRQLTIQAGGEAGAIIDLSPAEFDLLHLFLRHPQTVLSRDYLLQQTRGRDASPFDRTIDVRIGQLRKKIADPAGGVLFETIRGGGYLLNAAVLQQ